MLMNVFGKSFTKLPELESLEQMFTPEVMSAKLRELQRIPVDEIFEVLEQAAACFCGEHSRYRKRALAELPSLLGLSESMVRLGLDALEEMLSRKNLRERLHVLFSPAVLDSEMYVERGQIVKAMPVGLVCHVAAGNIFLGSIDSLVYGIITKNVNVLKASRQDQVFPELFFEALAECDTNGIVIPYCALMYWNRTDVVVEKLFKERSQLLLVFGGAEALRAWRNGVSETTEVAAFGPKLSFGIVDASMEISALTHAAQGFALDITLWEQRACTSCQNIFVKDGPNFDFFVTSLKQELALLARTFPQGVLPLDEKIEILRNRELALWKCYEIGGVAYIGSEGTFVVSVQNSQDVVDSPLNRTVFVNRISDFAELEKGNLRLLRANLSTVGVAVNAQREHEIMSMLSLLGVLRFCLPGQMAASNNERAPHDGIHLVSLLTRLVSYEGVSALRLGSGFTTEEERSRRALARLNTLLAIALRSPFYKQHLAGVKLPVRSLNEFSDTIPVLEKHHLLEHGADISDRMLTREPVGAYVFSAGGTTGSQKYVLYSSDEFKLSQREFGLGFCNAGISSNDVVANCFRSGAFWTAFIATIGGLEETGCKILSISGNQNEGDTMAHLARFQPNVIMGVTSNLLLIAQEAERICSNLKIYSVGYAGEHMSQPARAYLHRVFGVERFFSLGYAAVETGPIGFQCAFCEGTEHHPCDDWAFVESNAEGDVLVTTLERFLHPMVRYRVGDRIEWVNEECQCGRSSKKFRLLERTDDLVMFNVSHVSLHDVGSVLAEFSQFSPSFRLLVHPVADQVHLTIEVESNSQDGSEIVRSVADKLKLRCKALGVDAVLNCITLLEVKLVKPGELERIARTGKIRRVIDGRI
jgi:phenylacetate-coenzyme A ligase PaaK-like adenylate-forming protein